MKIKKLVLGTLACSAVALSCMAFSTNNAAAEVQLSDVAYKSVYMLGETFDVQDATITVNGESYDTMALVRFPDGRTVSKDSVVLSQDGAYTLIYKANTTNGVVKKEVAFSVESQAFSVGENGSFSYGTNDYLEDGTQGINVSLARGQTFTYNKVIKVDDNTANAPVIKWYCTPLALGTAEITNIYVRLTDPYDANNFVEVAYKSNSSNSGYTYVSAAANGQPSAGLEAVNAGTSGAFLYEERYCRLHRTGDTAYTQYYGFNSRTSFTGEPPLDLVRFGGTFADNYQSMSLDYAQKRVHTTTLPGDMYGGGRNLVMDLDDPLLVKENLWAGFSKGEAIVSLYATGYNATTFNFFVTEIDGEDLSKSGVLNAVPPRITVDYGKFDENDLPKAVVNKPFTAFDAIAEDEFDGIVECEPTVYYNYGSSTQSMVCITDGKFTPVREGVYSIVYTAKDAFGNVATKEVQITAISRDTLIYSFVNKETAFNVASDVRVADIEIENAFDGATVTMRARHKDDDALVYDIDGETKSFFPLYAGTYLIEYIYTDHIETQTLSYEITVNAVANPLFISEANVPRYLLKDCAYTFADFYAYDFSNGTNTVKADVSVKVGGTVVSENGVYTPNSLTPVEVVYTATNANGSQTKSYLLPVVDTGYGNPNGLNLSAYLQGSAFTSSATETYIAYTTDVAKATDSKATLAMLTSGYLDVLDVSFTVDATANNFDGVEISFINQTDWTDVISVVYAKSATGTDITVSRGAITYVGTANSSFDGNKEFGVSVSNGNVIFDGSDLKISVSELFADFSTLFFTDITLTGITGEAGIKVQKLMNQNMNSLTFEEVAPIVVASQLKTKYLLGEDIVIPQLKAYDFVDPNATLSASVTLTGGDYVTAKDGTVLSAENYDPSKSYVISADSYINCYLSVKTYDYTGNQNRPTTAFSVTDVTPPAITFTGGTTSCSVGDEVSLATCTATDDYSEVKVTVFVFAPNGQLEICESDSFTASEKGKYRVVFYVFDASGNCAFAEYTITSK
jgi:hypothetical protein